MTMGAGFIPKPSDSWPTWLVVLYYIAMGLIGLGFVAVMIIKTFKFLKKGQAGIRVRRGQPVMRDNQYSYVGPGIHPMIPFVDSIEEINVQEQVANLPPVLVEIDKRQLIIDARPTWRVIDTPHGVHDALFVPRVLEETVAAIMCKSLNRACSTSSGTDAVEEIARTIAEPELVKVGVELVGVGLISVTRVPVQVLGDLLGSADQSAIAGVAAATSLNLLQGGQAPA